MLEKMKVMCRNYIPFIFNSIWFLYRLMPDLINPTFPGDAGHRLNFANSLIVFNEERVWLPFLQFHINIFYLLHSPLFVYKLIPITYFIFSLFLINLIANRIVGVKVYQLVFTFILLFSLSNNLMYFYFGSNLYQEILVFAFFYLLFYLYYFGKKGIMFYLITLFGLFTRELFWIYYGVFLFLYYLGRKKISSAFDFIYPLFIIFPILWLIFTKQIFGLKNNTMYVPPDMADPIARVGRLIEIFMQNYLLIAFLFLIFSYLIIYFYSVRQNADAKSRVKKFGGFYIFSFISIILVYGYIILADPFQTTPYSFRMLAPLLIFLPIFFLLCFDNSFYLPKIPRLCVYILLILGMLSLGIGFRFLLDPFNYKYFQRKEFYKDIESAIKTYSEFNSKKITVGVEKINYWYTYVKYFVGPLLYQNRVFYSGNENSIKSDILIVPKGYRNNYYQTYRIFNLNKKEFQIMFRK